MSRYFCTTLACLFDKAPTPYILFFEALIIGCTVFLLTVLSKIQKKTITKFLIILTGVSLFELFTAPMWNNDRMGALAYIYLDISWILSLGWSSLILYVTFLVDHYFTKRSQLYRFMWYLIVLMPMVLVFESATIKIGIRSYAPEVLSVINGKYIPFLGVPVAALYYMPVFMTLVISFYKYWNLMLDKTLLIPINRRKVLRNGIIALISVVLFEIMVEPMVTNTKLPGWSFFYRDVSILLSGVWVIIIAAAINIVDTFFILFKIKEKFIAYLLIATCFATPFEAWLISNEYRVYGPSATANFSGFKSILFQVPVEVIFAIPFYLTLMICFIKYWELVFDNKL